MAASKSPGIPTVQGTAYCPMCTHTVLATIQLIAKKQPAVAPGQKCARCASALDAGIVFSVQRAA